MIKTYETKDEIPLPVCIKLLSGETLFGELLYEQDGVFFVRNTYTLVQGQRASGMVEIGMVKWIPFTDKNITPINAVNVATMVDMGREQKEIYGEMLLKYDLEAIKKELIAEMNKAAFLKKELVDAKFEDMLNVIINNSLTFGNIPPPISEVREGFNAFILKYFEPETEVKQ